MRLGRFLSLESFDFIVQIAFIIEEALQAFYPIEKLQHTVAILIQM